MNILKCVGLKKTSVHMQTNVNRNTENTTRPAPVAKHLKSLLHISIILLVGSGCKTEQPQKVSQTTPTKRVEVESPQLPDSIAQGIDQYFEKLFQDKKFNGVGLFYRNGEQYAFAKGLKQFEDTSDSLEISDQFQLASLSKPFTALATLQLVEKGVLHLDSAVSVYLSCTPYDDITLRQLLTHKSGIGYYAYVTDSIWDNPDYMMSNADLLTMAECKEIPNYFEPDRFFDYCNTNYALLANIIEKVTGITFADYMQSNIFEPLAMHNSEILNVFECDPLEYDVHGHYPNKAEKRPFYLDGVVGDKGMYSSVDDLLKFYKSMHSNNIVSDELWQEAISPLERYANGYYYGYGWRVRPLADGDTIIYHNGWWRGFKSYFWMSKKEDKMCVILTNWIRGGFLEQDEVWLLF